MHGLAGCNEGVAFIFKIDFCLWSRVNHSNNAIVKPQEPSKQEAQREVDAAMRKVKEATMAISASLEASLEASLQAIGKRSRSR